MRLNYNLAKALKMLKVKCVETKWSTYGLKNDQIKGCKVSSCQDCTLTSSEVNQE